MAVDVERIILRLGADAVQYNRAMTQAENRLLRFVEHSTRAGIALSLPLAAAAGAVTGLGVAMGAAAYQAINLASSWEQMSISMEVMIGNAERAKTLLGELQQLAINSPFTLKSVVANARQLMAFGVSNFDTVATVERLGDVAAGVSRGNLDEMMGRIVLAYGQVRTAGRLRGSELRQFTEAGIPLPEELAKVFKIPKEQIQDFVQQGKVGFADVQRAFNNMTSEGGRFFNMMERQSKTVAGRWNAFVETLQKGAIDVGTSFLQTFGITQLLDEWRESIQNVGQGQINEFFVRLRTTLEDLWLSIKGGYAVVRAMVVGIKDVVKAVYEWNQENGKAIKGIVIVVGSIVAAYYLVNGVMALAAAFQSVYAVITMIAASPLLPYIAAVAAALIALTAILEHIGAFDRMWETIVTGLTAIGDTLSMTWKGIKAAVETNDFDLAMQIIFKGIELGWRQTVATMKGVWYDFIFSILEWQAENFTIFGSKEMIIAGLRGAREERKAGLLDTPEIRKAREELEKLQQLAVEKARIAKLPAMGQNFESLMAHAERLQLDAAVHEQRLGKLRELAPKMLEKADEQLLLLKFPNPLEPPPQSSRFERLIAWGAIRRLGEEMILGHGAGFELTERRLGLRNRMRDEVLAPLMRDFLVGSFAPGVKGVPLGTLRQGIPIEFGPSGPAINLARDVLEDFQKTGGLGPFDLFNRNIGLLHEGRFGPPALRTLGGVVGGAGIVGGLAIGKLLEGMLSDPQYEFGLFQQYETVRKRIGNAPGPPPLAFRGSAEAQESINRAQTQIIDVQEQVRNTLIQIKEIQSAEREYMKQVVDELKKLNNEPGGGGGGWFPWDI